MVGLAAKAYSGNEYPSINVRGIRHALMAYTAPVNLTGYRLLCVAGIAFRPLACRSSVIEDMTTKSSEAAIEIERCNAESNNLKDDKDERDRNKRKPDPV